jgi:hypothetical protein
VWHNFIISFSHPIFVFMSSATYYSPQCDGHRSRRIGSQGSQRYYNITDFYRSQHILTSSFCLMHLYIKSLICLTSFAIDCSLLRRRGAACLINI